MAIYYWDSLTTTDFLELNREANIVILPIGSTEQHGPHLPVGTDTMILDEIITRIKSQEDDLDLIILPTLWCTKSIEHDTFVGTLSLQTETFIAVLHDIAASINRSGFYRLVLMNWHGGNSDLLSSLVRDLRYRHQLMVFLIDGLWINHTLADKKFTNDQTFDIHAGKIETGIMLSAYPENVKPGPFNGIGNDIQENRLAKSFRGYKFLIPEGGASRLGWLTRDVSQDGVIGDPSKSSASEGEERIQFIIRHVRALLHEISTFNFKT